MLYSIIQRGCSCFFIGSIMAAVLSVTGCTHPDGLRLENIPVEISKRIVGRKNCNCVAYAVMEGKYFRPRFLKKTSSGYQHLKLSIGEAKHFLPQSVSLDCNLIALFGYGENSERTDIYIYNIKEKTNINITKTLPSTSAAAIFSPVKNELAILSAGKIYIYDCHSRQLNKLNTAEKTAISFITWSAKGKYIFYEDVNTNILAFNTRTNDAKTIWNAPHSLQYARLITASEFNDEMFYFISDHASNFKQIYQYDKGKVTQITTSPFDKLLLQKPVINGYLYYRCNEMGEYKLRRVKNGVDESICDHGVIYDYVAAFEDTGIATYADQYNSPSLFEIKKGLTQNLTPSVKPDTLPAPVLFINKKKAVDFVYKPKGHPKGWVVWVHGGPKEQVSNRHMIYMISLLKKNYGLIALNYPGSIGFGNDYELINTSIDSILNEQVKGVREDLLELRKQYHISKYAIIGISAGSVIARAYMDRYEAEVSHYIEFCGVGYTDRTYSIPVLYIYGQNDPVMKEAARVRMINRQLADPSAAIVSLKTDAHTVIIRENILSSVNHMSAFLESGR